MIQLNSNFSGVVDQFPVFKSDRGGEYTYEVDPANPTSRCTLKVPATHPPNGEGGSVNWNGKSVRVVIGKLKPGTTDHYLPLADGGFYEADQLNSGWPSMYDYPPPVPPHFDPSNIPLSELARIRGAMWSTRWGGRFGPRPGKPDNILATEFLASYTPDEQAEMISIYASRGYTHCAFGPLIDSDGYHHKWPVPDRQDWGEFLDLCQMLWDAHIAPVCFLHPDTFNYQQTVDYFTPFLQDPRSQKLLRIVVPTGWEPSLYDWSSYQWAAYFKWARSVLPNALICMHTPSDADCPNGKDQFGDDTPEAQTSNWGKVWGRMVPDLHVWLVQNGPYYEGPNAPDLPELKENFANQFRKSTSWSLRNRFANGYAGWPTSSGWGAGQRLHVVNAECTAYASFWNNLPESDAQDWGDWAIRNDADGYLDGGRIVVP